MRGILDGHCKQNLWFLAELKNNVIQALLGYVFSHSLSDIISKYLVQNDGIKKMQVNEKNWKYQKVCQAKGVAVS